MADKNFTLSIEIIAKVGQAMQGLGAVYQRVSQLAKSTKGMREIASTAGIVGGVMAGTAAAIALPLKSGLSAYAEEQAALAHVRTAMTENADTMRNLNEVRRMSHDLASKSVMSVEALDNSYYIATSNMLKHRDALRAVQVATLLTTATTRNAADAQAALEPTTRTLTSLSLMFGGSIAAYGNQLTKFQSQYAFRDIAEINYALAYAMPVAKQTGVAVAEMNAALALLSAGGLHGAEAGVAFQQFVGKLATDTKLAGFIVRTRQGGIDLQRTLQVFAETFGAMSPLMRARELSALGFGESDVRGISILMDRYAQMGTIENDLANSRGVAAQKAAVMNATFNSQFAMMANSWANFKSQIGGALAPAVGTLVAGLGKVLSKITAFAQAHPIFTQFAVLAAAGTAAVLGLAGAVALAAAGLAFMGVSAATALAVAFPIAAAIGAVAAAALLLYSRWGEIVAYVRNINWRNVGMAILKGIGAGLLAGLVFLTGPLGVVAKHIIDHFRGHSPPPLGPLHDGLRQIRIVETIAEAIRPAPMLTAIRRVAAATAFAVPMAIGAGATPVAASTMQGPSASAATVINISVTCNFNGGASSDFDAKKHAYEIVEAMHRELARRRRTEF